jgi:hypothetical protein
LRRLFTSLPTRTIPHSSVWRISKRMPSLAVLGHHALRSGGLAPGAFWNRRHSYVWPYVMYRSLRRPLLLIKSPPASTSWTGSANPPEAALEDGALPRETNLIPAQVRRFPLCQRSVLLPMACRFRVRRRSRSSSTSWETSPSTNIWPYSGDSSMNWGRRLAPASRSLICEHPPLITVGRRGSRAHIKLSGEQLRWRQLPYPVGQSRRRLRPAWPRPTLHLSPRPPSQPAGRSASTSAASNRASRIPCSPSPSPLAWASTGLGNLGTVGPTGRRRDLRPQRHHSVRRLSERESLHEQPPLSPRPRAAEIRTRSITNSPTDSGPSQMGCLLAEKSQGVKMAEVRAALMEHLSAAWGAESYHVLTGHPFLEKTPLSTRGTNARAS